MVQLVQTEPPARPRIVPNAYVTLSNWRYVEHSILRIIAGWGRSAGDWEDKLAVCNHVWLQAQIVNGMRRRADMYPGGKPDQQVNQIFETVCNAVLLAPSFEDAMAGVHEILNPALLGAYRRYMAASHPVHDRPTFDLLKEVIRLKEEQSQWFESFRRRYPKPVDQAYAGKIRALIAPLENFSRLIELTEPFARQCGVGTDFRMPITPGRVKHWDRAPKIMPFLETDWATSVEARRLYFMIGYCWEMGVAEQQLRWIYNCDFMPWEFIYAESRHMWDESRHGNSGYHRLRDFGFDFEHFGYNSYNARGEGVLDPMSPVDIYNVFYAVTQIAETGYFETKRYCFDDFAAGGDEGSAEMMQYDIIDETSHVEYGRIWLNDIMKRAGIKEDYRKRGQIDRVRAQKGSDERVESYRRFLAGETPVHTRTEDHGGNSFNPVADDNFAPLRDERARKHYEWMLTEIREKCPLKNVSNAPLRPNLPM